MKLTQKDIVQSWFQLLTTAGTIIAFGDNPRWMLMWAFHSAAVCGVCILVIYFRDRPQK